MDYPPQVLEPSRWIILGVLLLLASVSTAGGPRTVLIVTRVVDGDTVWGTADGAERKIRLLGVDTPELGRDGTADQPWAREARRFTAERVEAAYRVELEVAGDRIDAYGRTLGFLWLVPRGAGKPENLSETLLEAGLAEAIRGFDYPGKAHFLDLEAHARRGHKGRWR